MGLHATLLQFHTDSKITSSHAAQSTQREQDAWHMGMDIPLGNALEAGHPWAESGQDPTWWNGARLISTCGEAGQGGAKQAILHAQARGEALPGATLQVGLSPSKQPALIKHGDGEMSKGCNQRQKCYSCPGSRINNGQAVIYEPAFQDCARLMMAW